MPYEQLLESVDESATEKILKIKEKVTREAAEIQKEAAGKDEIIKKRFQETAKRAVEMERSKSSAQIKKETRMQLIHAKDAVYQKAFSEAQNSAHRYESRHITRTVLENCYRKWLLSSRGRQFSCVSINGMRTSVKNCCTPSISTAG